ncbi:phosphoribosyltransferase [Aestuariibius sp. 2305UL40-4]|uniref:phosphoribosyltransferase n=1 Tax=Aestuariibius violaceus TaxID=3234132 RepID=UPI00345E5BAC
MSWRGAMFADRVEAGRALAAALPPLDPEDTVVVALPRGGVPVAAEICRARGLPMDLVFVRKIGAPGQPELAVGAIVDGDRPVVERDDRIAGAFGLSAEEVAAMGRDLLPEIARRKARYLAGRARPDLAGKTVVVVDDGIATGATMGASLRGLRAAGAGRIILAVPVAPPEVLARFEALADEVICLCPDPGFRAVGAYYARFPQVSDEEVISLLAEAGRGDGGGDAP